MPGWELWKACAPEESVCVAAKDIKLLYDDPIAWVSEFVDKMPDAHPSMY